jgi:hypothetical protein
MRRLFAILICASAACGGGSSPSAPTPSLNLAGNWAGSFQFVTSGVTITDGVTATFTQTGTNVTGTWRAESGGSGQFTQLAAQASTSGSVTISQTTITGATCNATAAFNGTASASALDLNVAQIPANGTCQWASGMQFALRKQ